MTNRQKAALIRNIKKTIQAEGKDEALLEFYPDALDNVIETAVEVTLEKVES